jgi:hypothetical protein
LITEFDQKIENKNNLRERSLDEQEWHLSLEMPTSEMAHVERERENTHAEEESRQSLSN